MAGIESPRGSTFHYKLGLFTWSCMYILHINNPGFIHSSNQSSSLVAEMSWFLSKEKEKNKKRNTIMVEEAAMEKKELTSEAMVKDDDNRQEFAYIYVVQKPSPIIHTMSCTLEELYSGTHKKIKIKQHIYDHHGNWLSTQVNYDYLEIGRGLKTGDRYRFPKMGDIIPGTIPADVIFVVEGKPHAVFQRDGNDLIITKTITLEDALREEKMTVETLDKRLLRIPIRDAYATEKGLEIVVPNEGMPIYSCERKGVLVVKFDVISPVDSSSKLGEVELRSYSTSSQKDVLLY